MKLWMIALMIALLALLALVAAPAAGRPVRVQEGGGFEESFEGGELRGWEHHPDVTVADGALNMPPRSFALRIGDWSEIALDVRLRFSGEGLLLVNTYFRGEQRYGLRLAAGEIALEKSVNGAPQELARAEAPAVQPNAWLEVQLVVQNGQLAASVNGEQLLTASDPEPLGTGALLLETAGELSAEIDSLALTGRPGGGAEGLPPAEEPPPAGVEGQLPAMEQAPAPTTVPAAAADGRSWLEALAAGQATRTELGTFAVNLLLAAAAGYLLGLAYTYWGASLSNRRKFAANFVLLTVTTTFVILVVRSSVALSLGLVGALSIVRFRTAVKETEELAYLFFAIALGIGLGDNQRLLTLLVLAAGIALIGLMKLLRRPGADANLHLTVASRSPRPVDLDAIMAALQPHTAQLKLLRLDETAGSLEAGFLVEFRRTADLSAARAALRGLSDGIEITLMDNKGLW